MALTGCIGENLKELGTDAFNDGEIDKAYSHWLPLAAKGDVEVQEAVALLLASGELRVGMSQEEMNALAVTWMTKSAIGGHRSAMKYLSDSRRHGWLGLQIDAIKSKCWKDASIGAVNPMECS